ncbi:hypothetical protein HII31_00142 [Pseudocercospora fuligena]|uniref:Uncharacterized protein n=1 Tax=Pseudocercospora fuligena TaxID=685502 RepID=A0A8H6VN32_9PEZI|nr:hypothetical protein HII31_00142 [Pseudocercospora fuligena]
MLSFAAVKKAFFTFAYSLVALLFLTNMEISVAKIERMLTTIGFFFVLACSAAASLLVFSLLCALVGIAKARFDRRNDEYYRKIHSPFARRRQEEVRRWQAAYRRRLEDKKQSAKTVQWTGLKHLPAPPTALEIEQKRRKHEDWERKHRLVPETPSFIPLRPLFAAPLPVQPLRQLQRPQPPPLPSAVYAPICRASITGTTIFFPHLAAQAAPLLQQVNTTDLAPTISTAPPEMRSTAHVSMPQTPFAAPVAPLFQQVKTTDLAPTTTMAAPETRSVAEVSMSPPLLAPVAAPPAPEVTTTDLNSSTSSASTVIQVSPPTAPPAATPSAAPSASEPCPRHPDGGEHATKGECAFCASEALMMGEVPADEDPDL